MDKARGLAVTIPRILFGLLFLASGLMGLLMGGEQGEQPEMAPEVAAFSEAMMETGYLFQLVKITEIVCGAALVSGFFVPLALIVITPIIVNIVALHVFLDGSGQGIGISVVLVAFLAYLTYRHWDIYKPLVQAKPGKSASSNAAGEE